MCSARPRLRQQDVALAVRRLRVDGVDVAFAGGVGVAVELQLPALLHRSSLCVAVGDSWVGLTPTVGAGAESRSVVCGGLAEFSRLQTSSNVAHLVSVYGISIGSPSAFSDHRTRTVA